MADTRDAQIAIAEALQLKALEHFQDKLNDGSINATELATLVRLLVHNGWILDRTRLPQGIADKVTSKINPDELDDIDVLRFPRAAEG